MSTTDLAIDLAFHGAPERIAAHAHAIEQRPGIRGLFVSEAQHDPFVSLTLAATSTEQLELGTSVAIAFARTPMTMAYCAYDVHRVAGGRTILGLGSQIGPHIKYRYDMPWSQPAARMREYVSALRAIWHCWQHGGKLDFRGDFYTHTLMPPLFSPGPLDFPSPPIWIAGVGPKMVDVAGAVADGLICHPLISRSYLRDVLSQQVTTSRLTAHRQDEPFVISTMAMVATGRTEKAVNEAIAGTRQQIAFYASTLAYKPVLHHHGWDALHDEAHALSKAGRWRELGSLIDDDILNTFAVVGEIDTVGAALRARFAGLVDRVTVSMPYQTDGNLDLDIAGS
jgi:probable F420-dependent oxidoreductase